MGQKVSPRGLRIGVIEGWQSRWYAGKHDFARFLGEDRRLRAFLKEKLHLAGIAKIDIERAADKVKVNIYSAKPGLVIGKKGKDIDDLRKELRSLIGRDVSLNIIEVRKPDLDAQLAAESIASQIERRVGFRKAMKDIASKALRAGAEGVKVAVSGRLNGADIARVEKYREGRVPLHTLRADIDYGVARASTTYGIIGVKTWIFKGEKFEPGEEVQLEVMAL
ncbi:MAG TPA: 30S ribosomal protein S3 [Oligoflexia bacterium]|nr:30S ribosomal protein S3 [Oligoflexia bacterium]HMP26492.1 30S ribosomal protein S3 [Oligoflexia bacterium]